jgi:hypothetical protein
MGLSRLLWGHILWPQLHPAPCCRRSHVGLPGRERSYDSYHTIPTLYSILESHTAVLISNSMVAGGEGKD